MAKYQAYAEYKDSGVEWLGDIPKHWQTVSLKMLIDVRDGTHDTPPYVEPNFNTYPLVTSKDVTGGRVDLSNCKHISELDYSNIIKRSGVSKGDILMPMIGTVGSPVLVEDKFEIAIKNLALFKTSIGNEKLDSKFLFYFLNSTECETQFSLEGKGGVQNFVSLGTLRNLVLPLTKTSEQIKIANFLDHETTKIDHLIEKQQQLIELLKEKRQAVISHAVTKGLDPNVPMKDSGVEWLGEVPEHWILSKLKWRAVTTSGSTPSTSKYELYYEDGSIPWIRTTDLNNDDLYETPISITPRGVSDTACSVLPVNSILIAMYGGAGSIGKHSLLKFESTINQAVCGVLPSKYFNSDYLHRFYEFYRPFWMIGASGTRKDPNIGQDHIKEALVPLPPLEEQVQIANFITEMQTRYDAITQKAELAIQLMQERRTALISAAVTGKIDVRNWQASTVAEAHTEFSA